MKIFLTGSSGCLASVLLPVLCADNAVTGVTGIDIAAPTFSHPKFKHVTLDMRSPEVQARMAGHEAVIHLAFAVKRGSLGVEEMADINVGGSRNVVDAAAAHGITTFLNLSSVSVYGAGENMAEDAEPNPPTWFQYAQHKVEVERYLAARIPTAAQIRAHLIVGAQAQKFLREIFLLPVWLDFGSSTPKQQVVHEADVVDAILAVLQKGASGIYNVAAADVIALGGDYIRKGQDEGRRIRRMPFGIVRAVARCAQLVLKNDLLTLVSMLNTTATVTCEKAGRDLGWRPRRSAWQARTDALRSLDAR
jgi:UDP-glucose 4-epimerase